MPSLGTKYVFNLVVIVTVICISQAAALAEDQFLSQGELTLADPTQKDGESRDFSSLTNHRNKLEFLGNDEITFGDILNKKYIKSQKTWTSKDFARNNKKNLEYLDSSGGEQLKRVQIDNGDKDKEETVDQFIFPLFRKRNLEYLAKSSGGYLKRVQNNNDDNDKEEPVDKIAFPLFRKRNLEHLAKTSGGYLKRDQNNNNDNDKEEAVDKFTFPSFSKRNLEHLAKTSGGDLKRDRNNNNDNDKEEAVDTFIFPSFRKRNLEYLAESSGGYLRRIKYDTGDADKEQNVNKIVKAINEIVGKHKRGVHVLAKNRDFPNKKPKQKMKQVSVTTYIYMKRRNPDYQSFQD